MIFFLSVVLLGRNPINLIGYSEQKVALPAGKLSMERKSIFMLAAIIFLLLGSLVLIVALWQNIEVGYAIGLAFSLLGAISWINAE